MTIYDQLKEATEHKICSYIEDLTKHDKKALETNKGAFLHATRETGTALMFFNLFEPEEKTMEEYERLQEIKRALAEFFDYYLRYDATEKRQLWHYYDGKKLKAVTVKQAETIYNNKVLRKQNSILEELLHSLN